MAISFFRWLKQVSFVNKTSIFFLYYKKGRHELMSINSSSFSHKKLYRRGQNYIYPILNWNVKPGSSLIAAFGVLFLGAVIHSILVCIHRIRGKVHKKFFGPYHTVSNSSTKNNLRDMEAQEQNNIYDNNCI